MIRRLPSVVAALAILTPGLVACTSDGSDAGAPDGLAPLAQRHRAGLEIEDGKSPTPRFLFPETPAASRRAVIQFVSPFGRVVAVFGVSRYIARGAWHVESVHECA